MYVCVYAQIDKGLYPKAFCKIIPDLLAGDPGLLLPLSHLSTIWCASVYMRPIPVLRVVTSSHASESVPTL